MKMKKGSLIAIILMFVLVLVLSACGKSEEPKESTNGGTAEPTTAKKTLRVVTEAVYAPAEYMSGGEIKGFDIDFVKAFAEAAGYEVKFENVAWDPLFVEVKQGSADMGVSAISIDDERKKTYDFSHPYFISINKILVPEGSPIKSAKDLKEKTVALLNASTAQTVAEEILGKNSSNIKKFENNTMAIMELLNNGADAVIADNAIVEEYAKKNPDKKLVVIDEPTFSKEFYGLIFPKGSKDRDEINKGINKTFEDGTYAKIYKEWFGVEPDIATLKAQQ